MPSLNQTITNAAYAAGVPPSLALAQAQKESSLDPSAVNPRTGASGLFQLLPSTAQQLGVSNILDPTENAAAGTAYLAQLYAQFGDWSTALAAYDWGARNVTKAQAAYGANWLAHAPSETQNYVADILGNAGALGPFPASSGISVGVPAAASADVGTGDAAGLGPGVQPGISLVALSPQDMLDAGVVDSGGDLLVPSAAPNWLVLAGVALAAWFGFNALFAD